MMKDMTKSELVESRFRLMLENQSLKRQLEKAKRHQCCICALVDSVEAWLDRVIKGENKSHA